VQAANLLRALRQSKEAAALGLLEGVKGERGASDIEVGERRAAGCSRCRCLQGCEGWDSLLRGGPTINEAQQ
jgi:hypothetical protein